MPTCLKGSSKILVEKNTKQKASAYLKQTRLSSAYHRTGKIYKCSPMSITPDLIVKAATETHRSRSSVKEESCFSFHFQVYFSLPINLVISTQRQLHTLNCIIPPKAAFFYACLKQKFRDEGNFFFFLVSVDFACCCFKYLGPSCFSALTFLKVQPALCFLFVVFFWLSFLLLKSPKFTDPPLFLRPLSFLLSLLLSHTYTEMKYPCLNIPIEERNFFFKISTHKL